MRRVLLKLGYRCRRPKLGPRLVDPQREAIHQEIGKRIAEAAPGTVVLVEDETDLRLVPLLRRMRMRLREQVVPPAPVTNQCRTLFGTLDIHTGEVFYRGFARKRTIEMIAFLEDLLARYAGRQILLSSITHRFTRAVRCKPGCNTIRNCKWLTCRNTPLTGITRLRNSGGGSKVLSPPTGVAAQWKSCSRWPTSFSNN